MTQLLLFFSMFALISFIFDWYCNHRIRNNATCLLSEGILKTDINSVLFLSFLLLIPTLLVAFRSESTGVDTSRYMDLFLFDEEYIEYRVSTSAEFLFWSTFKFFYKSGNEVAAFFFYAFVPLIVSYLSLYKMSIKTNPFLTSMVFLLLFYHELFNAMRQMPAIAFVFLGCTYLIERKKLMFFICVAIAAMFHTSALFAIPIYFFCREKEQDFIDFFHITFFFIVLMIAGYVFFDFFLSIDIFSRYLNYTMEVDGDSFTNGIKSFVVYCVPIFLLLIFFYKEQSSIMTSLDRRESCFYWNLIIAFCMLICMRIFSNWFFRLAFYYQIGEIFLIGKIGLYSNKERFNSIFNRSISKVNLVVVYIVVYEVYLHYLHNFQTSALVNFSLR